MTLKIFFLVYLLAIILTMTRVEGCSQMKKSPKSLRSPHSSDSDSDSDNTILKPVIKAYNSQPEPKNSKTSSNKNLSPNNTNQPASNAKSNNYITDPNTSPQVSTVGPNINTNNKSSLTNSLNQNKCSNQKKGLDGQPSLDGITGQKCQVINQCEWIARPGVPQKIRVCLPQLVCC